MINNWLIYLKVSYLRQYVFVCSCLTLAATTVISSAWCPYSASWKITSIVASCVTWLVILSILLARKRTLEFYAEQLIIVKAKKEDQEKGCPLGSLQETRWCSWWYSYGPLARSSFWSTHCRWKVLIHFLSLKYRPLSASKSCHPWYSLQTSCITTSLHVFPICFPHVPSNCYVFI